jgi:hypothetical protein
MNGPDAIKKWTADRVLEIFRCYLAGLPPKEAGFAEFTVAEDILAPIPLLPEGLQRSPEGRE